MVLALVCLAGSSPADAFQNGRAPQSALAPIFTPQKGKVAYLVKGAPAASWNTMNLCASAAARPLSPGDSIYSPAATAYRTYRVQEILYRQMPPGWAARPGTSNHGNQVGAVDLRHPSSMQPYVIRNGGQFGWRWGEVRHEPWHVSRRPGASFRRPDPGASFRYPRMRRGSGGRCQAPAVKEIQRRVGVRQDGEFGKATSKGVRRVQRSKPFRKCLKRYRFRRSPLGVVQSPEWICMRELGRKITAENGGGTTVRPNTQGQDVRAVQGLLNARLNELHRGHLKVKVDGSWDTADKRALKTFQRLVGIKPTGVADPKTYAALRKPRNQDVTRLDEEGLLFLIREEGSRRTPYNDSAGHCTVGVGHLIHRGPCTRDDYRRWNLTEKGVLALLRKDVRSRERFVAVKAKPRLRQGEFNAYVSFVFNIGENGFAKSTTLRRLNAGDRRGACDAMLLWHRGGRPYELLPRRERERALCLRR
ncbi:MAG: peptidoglycan-binding protein [Actinomycetota bacterium]|nr:peptidoglycan-binding protein [Actinomycetota bacterium]